MADKFACLRNAYWSRAKLGAVEIEPLGDRLGNLNPGPTWKIGREKLHHVPYVAYFFFVPTNPQLTFDRPYIHTPFHFKSVMRTDSDETRLEKCNTELSVWLTYDKYNPNIQQSLAIGFRNTVVH